MYSKNNVTQNVKNVKTQPVYDDGLEYIVCLKSGIDYDKFWSDMETVSNVSHIPNRAVAIINERVNSPRSCHYIMTKDEATKLSNDSRVLSVSIPLYYKHNTNIHHTMKQYNNFDKTTTSSGNNVNWGLSRINSSTNNYGTSNSVIGEYNYTLDGSGVDVVIMDTGIELNHPEFKDSNGNSRVQQINWYTESGVSGTQHPNFYSDVFGHGTHVAGIAAGKTFGWAKNAQIYSIKMADLVYPTDSTGLPYFDCFDVLIGWHNNKPINPETGYKRPTIVNMSWGISGNYYTVYPSTIITGGNYRGTSWTDTSIHPEYGMGDPTIGSFPIRDVSTDTAIDDMIAAGIHVCIASGNDAIKVDLPPGLDYNNYFVDTYSDTIYYNQGSSPYSFSANIIGAIDVSSYSDTLEKKAFFSDGGPGVKIYSPGTGITSAMSQTNQISNDGYEDAEYFLDTSWKQANLDGTSMASPQVTGLGALFLQVNPFATPSQLQNWLIYNSKQTLYTSGLNNDYDTYFSVWGGPNSLVYNIFNSSTSFKVS